MGSIVGTVGARGGIAIPITGATENIILTSVPGPYPTIVNTTIVYVAFEFGWRAFMFQVLPAGSSGISVAVNVTLDVNTATGNQIPGNWEEAPVPTATPPFSNPMTGATGERLCRIDSGPWSAFQLVVTGAGASSSILFAAGA